MPALILHHYDTSPFSEKVRLMLGLKGLAWRSVIQPVIMPKPDLIPLTGGYRRIPVMQIGADIYCDTQVILRASSSGSHPAPTLYPAGCEGALHGGLSFAWDPCRCGFPTTRHPVALHRGRPDSARVHQGPQGRLSRLRHEQGGGWRRRGCTCIASASRRSTRGLKTALADGRGATSSATRRAALDLTCYHTIFLLRKNCPVAVDAMAGARAAGSVVRSRERTRPWPARSDECRRRLRRGARRRRPGRRSPILAPDGDPGGLRAGCRGSA